MMLRWGIAVGLIFSLPAMAQESEDIFATGNVLCSGYQAESQTCRTITIITKRDGDTRFATSRRKVALPNDQVRMETAGASRVEGLRACALYATAKPKIKPTSNKYMEALIMVHERKRDYRLARNVCVEYRPCGAAYHVYRSHDGLPEPKLISLTTVFKADDPVIAKLWLRSRVYGVAEPVPTDCEPSSS